MMDRHVVAGIDGSRPGLAAAEWAAAEAEARGTALRLVHVALPEPAERPARGTETWRLGAERMVRGAVTEITRRRPGLDVVGEQATGVPAAALAAACGSAGLLVLGTRGLGGFEGLALGSVALELAGRAPCPVVLVPAARTGEEKEPEVVLGIDARRPARAALRFAFETARRRGARLRAVHAWCLPAPYAAPWAPYEVLEEERGAWEDQEVQLLDDALHGWREEYPTVSVLPDVRLFSPAEALVKTSAGAGLVVAGRGGGPGTALGGVPHAVAHHARCPVALVPEA
ncbi:universal stress protein [Streptomyces sp. WAC 00631]|uniref:universal stress protein n=1 Tax=unclassified Streptomyces TaxID=2593676 RepID=UPI001E4BE6F7|nr:MULTISPECIES: universal stress protein [unclassified Streptomyces]MCC5036968.1 universal stress protein [Streptomyces sp. WAC 00631]MCC9737898.1 universal stress protein [Streptomyces sp. MNU89]